MNQIAKLLVAASAVIATGAIAPLSYADGMEMSGDMNMSGDMHQHHHQMVMPETTRRTVEYTIPDVTLVRDDGKRTTLPEVLNDGRPVVLNFIFTTCTAVCPVISHTLQQLQDKLGNDRDRVHIVSISIDPEQDTVEKLAAYSKKYGAGPEWNHYTSTLETSIKAQRAFDVYRGDKMNHIPVTLLRDAPGNPWIRIEGFATAKKLLADLHQMLAANDLQHAEVSQ